MNRLSIFLPIEIFLGVSPMSNVQGHFSCVCGRQIIVNKNHEHITACCSVCSFTTSRCRHCKCIFRAQAGGCIYFVSLDHLKFLDKNYLCQCQEELPQQLLHTLCYLYTRCRKQWCQWQTQQNCTYLLNDLNTSYYRFFWN